MAQFFADQVVKDVKLLAQCLQHSPDESVLLIHHILSQVKLTGDRKRKECVEMSSKEARNEYERRLREELIESVMGGESGSVIQELTRALAEDAKSSGSNQLFKIAYDLLEPTGDNNGAEFLNNRKFW